VTAGKVLKTDIGEGADDGMQVDNVADHETVMPDACFQAHGVVKRQRPHARPQGLSGLVNQPGCRTSVRGSTFQFITRTGKPQLQGRVTAASRMATNLAQTVSSTIGATLIGILSYKPLLLIVAVVAAVAAIPVLAFPVQPPARPALAIRDRNPRQAPEQGLPVPGAHRARHPVAVPRLCSLRHRLE
jgi:hypothetical protein